MKAPDEIKRALDGCAFTKDPDCAHCPYFHEKWCMEKMRFDASVYIRQLENRIDEFAEKVERFKAGRRNR